MPSLTRALVLPLWIVSVTYSEFDEVPMSLALDATYAGWHAPSTLKHIIIMGWVLLGVAIISAMLESCYKWYKVVIIFAALTALMGFMTFNTMNLYEPYLAVRR